MTRDREPIEVRIYVFTGKHGLFKIPAAWCRECDLFVRAADLAAEEASVPVLVKPVSWWWRWFGSLRYGIKNPPIMVIDGELFTSGYGVPTAEAIVERVHEAARAKGYELDGVQVRAS